MAHIPKEDLKHGAYYYGRCRNADVARWNGEEQCFYHWRAKFNMTFIEKIKCPEDEKHYDVFYAEHEIQNVEQGLKKISFTEG